MSVRHRTRAHLSEDCVIACETPESESDQLMLFKAACNYSLYGAEPNLKDDQLCYLFETVIRPWIDGELASRNKGSNLPKELRIRGISETGTPAIHRLIYGDGGTQ